MSSPPPATPPAEPPPRRLAVWRFFAAAVVAALTLALLERGLDLARGQWAEPGLGARWIWAQGVFDQGEPVAFFLRRDFVLEQTAPAWLAIAADEEYVLWVNGQRRGSGVYQEGEAIDFYDLGDLLEPGNNRLAVELRSSRGAGGLLASLRLGEPDEPFLVSDASWRVHRHFEPALLRGWELADRGAPPVVWGSHPTGRWRLLPPGAPRALSASVPLPPAPAAAARVATPGEPPLWVDLEPFSGHGFPELGSRLLLDWGEEVHGVLELELESSNPRADGLVYLGSDLPKARPPADAFVLPVPGKSSWEDTVARTFRYAFLVGIEPRAIPVVRRVPTAPNAAQSQGSGAFGVTPPRRETLSEEIIRQRALPDGNDRSAKESARESP